MAVKFGVQVKPSPITSKR